MSNVEDVSDSPAASASEAAATAVAAPPPSVRDAYERFIERTDAAFAGPREQSIIAGAIRIAAWFFAIWALGLPVSWLLGVVHMEYYATTLLLCGSVGAFWWARSAGVRVWRPGWPEAAMTAFAAVTALLALGFVGFVMPFVVLGVIFAVAWRLGLNRFLGIFTSLFRRR